MDNEMKGGLVVFIVCLIGIGNAWYGISTRTTIDEVTITEYSIYHCTAPFGLIWVEESSSGSFLFIVGSYSSTSALTETYNVKAFANNELFTKVFDATKVRVVPDGAFYLEKQHTEQVTWDRNGKELFRYNRGRKWLIHIPELPRLNQTISMEWAYVGS